MKIKKKNLPQSFLNLTAASCTEHKEHITDSNQPHLIGVNYTRKLFSILPVACLPYWSGKYLYVLLSVYLSVRLCIYLCIYLPIYLFMYVCIYLCIYLALFYLFPARHRG